MKLLSQIKKILLFVKEQGRFWHEYINKCMENKAMRVCAIALIVIFTAVPFSFGAETVPTVTDIKNQSIEYLENSHISYELVTTPTYADDERTIYINGTAYYYTPNESSEEKNKQLINLVQTGGKALITTTNLSEAVFTYGSIYYTYDKTKLPQSVYSYGDGSETNYNVAYNDGTTTMYKTINLIPANMKTPTGTGSLEWTKVSDGTGYDWADTTTFPQTSTIKYTDDGAGTLSKAEGVVRFRLPGVGDNVEQLYKFEFIPTGEKHARLSNLTADINGGYFYGLTSDGNGGAIANTSTDGYSIVADFIKNSATTYGGAIWNNGTINSITGDFIGNSANYGGAIRNEGTITTFTGDFIGNSANYGGAIRNEGTITTFTGDFIGNSATYGGAIYNNTNATISNITGDFIGNSAANNGGAISNTGDISSITGDFIGNSANYGGAIYNNTNATISNITGDFIGNSAANNGGAIYNNTNATISNITGDFIGNSAANNGGAIRNYQGFINSITGDFIGNSATISGGAINNGGTISSITGDFTGNSARTSGGAIYNAGTISLLADTKNIVFENNYQGTVTRDENGNITDASNATLNDIYNQGTVNLQSKEGKSITFSGTITDAATPTGTTNIGEASSAYTGTVNFNNKVTQNAINLNSGTLHLGVANAIASVTTFTVNGCTLDTVTDAIETQALGSTFTLNNNLDWNMEAALTYTAKGADNLGATTLTDTNKTIQLQTIKIVSSADKRYTKTYISDAALKDIFALKEGYTITKADSVTGTYTVEINKDDNGAYLLFKNSDVTNFVSDVRENTGTNTITLTEDINVANDIAELGDVDLTTSIGSMGGTSLTIDGGNNSILGGGKGGVTVGTSQTLNINGGTWKNFNKTGNGAVVSNSGTLAIDTVTLENNTATGGGGAVYNNSSTGIFPFVISNSTFNNSNAQDGGAIYNEGTLLVMNLNFAHNSATRYGGAMFNGGSITTDIMGTFTSNSATSHGGAIFNKDGNTNKIYSIGKSGTTTFESNTSGTGGAIYNGGVITRGIDATFTSNTATNNGGAIYNAGNREIGGVSGTFTSNSAGSKGGAIYNTGRIGASSDTAPAIVATFDSNSAYSGGAIYNNTSGTIYGINSTFTKNRAIGGYGNGGAIDNEGTITYIEGSFGTSGDSTKGNTGAYGGAIYHNSNTAISRIGDENALTTGFYYNNATEGGALFNETNKTITTVNAVFDHNSATSGGAVYNKGTITTLKGEFTNNTATSNGGVLFNSGGVVSNMSGVFTSNTSNAWGGVVYNSGTSDLGELTGTFSSNNATFGGVLFNETSTVDLISGTFTGNRATTGAGGVLYTRGNITEISGTFSNNTASTYGGVLELGDSSNSVTIGKISGTFENNTAASRGGGAIYLSKGTVSDLSGTFRNNSSTSGTGGAINTNTGTTLNITTTSGNTLFSGNTDSTGSNAIDGSGTINMNAGEGKSITFDDKISGTSTININDSSVKSDMTSGTVTFNESVNATAATVSGGTVNLNNTFTSNALNLTGGTVNLGNTNSVLNVTNFTASGGTLSTQNGTTSATSLGNVVLNGVLSLAMDADLSGTGSADTFSATSVTGTGSININNIKILADSTSALPITIGTFDDDLKTFVTLSSTSVDGVAAGKSYKVSYDKTNGSLKFGYGNLYNAVKDTSTERTYTMGTDENVAQDLGVMNGEKLTVDGNNYAVNGNNHAGITVNSGQTLEINNVGAVDTDGNITNNGWNNFNRAFVNNGTLKLTNSTVVGNKAESSTFAYAAVIAQGAGSNVSEITNVVFKDNYVYSTGANANGSIIDNYGGTVGNITNSAFIGNYAKSTASYVYGGVFSNNNTGVFNNISGTFTGNYVQTTASNTNANGGVLDNAGGTVGNISGTFTNNRAISYENTDGTGYTSSFVYGGVISNSGTIGNISGTFDSNYVKAYGARAFGGLIHNTGSIQDVSGTFKGNYAYSETRYAYGGLINNENTIGKINGTFENNGVVVNSGKSAEGGVFRNSGTLGDIGTVSDTKFENNYVKTNGTDASWGQAEGGVVNNTKTIGNIGSAEHEVLFKGNYASANAGQARGGAIYNAGNDAKIENVYADFNTNYAVSQNGYAEGGAIHNAGIIKHLQNKFSGNYATANNYARGGAIHNEAEITDGINATFENNYVKSTNAFAEGGALNNRVNGAISTLSGSFSGNYAETVNGSAGGGAIYNSATIGKDSAVQNVSFDTNYVLGKTLSGGAILNNGTIYDLNTYFKGNYANAENSYAVGGAISNSNTIKNITETPGHILFESNYAISEQSYARGGAIDNYSGTIGNISGRFIGNYVNANTTALGGALENELGTVGNITNTEFKNNYITSQTGYGRGGAIDNYRGHIGNITTNENGFSNNYIEAKDVAFGGAISNESGQIGEITADFTNNHATADNVARGGAIDNTNGTITSITGDFKNNYVIGNSNSNGGAIYNTGTVTLVASSKDMTFEGNYVNTPDNLNDIYNSNTLNLNAGETDSTQHSITFNGTITGDSSTHSGVINVNDSSKNANVNGKVQFNNTVSNNRIIQKAGTLTFNNSGSSSMTVTESDGTTVVYDGDYKAALNNATTMNAIKTTLKNNGTLAVNTTSNTYGGTNGTMIAVQGGVSNIDGSVVSNNIRGAVSVSNGATLNVINGSLLSGNTNTSNGGAIFNEGTTTISNAILTNNTVNGGNMRGGAIYNAGTINNLNAIFNSNASIGTGFSVGGAIMNMNGTITSLDGGFYNNYAQGGWKAGGGAINNEGSTASIQNIGSNSDTTFSNNYVTASSVYGGAIYNDNAYFENIGTSTYTTEFVGNYGSSTGQARGGAIYNYGTITNIRANFSNNYIKTTTNNNYAVGGAIMNHDHSITSLDGNFENNYANATAKAAGGAIDNENGQITNIGTNTVTKFVKNYARVTNADSSSNWHGAYGGAIDNNHSTISHIGSSEYKAIFEKNYVVSNANIAAGGAISNVDGSTINDIHADFTNNYTVSDNGRGGAIFNATNSNITLIDSNFSENSANQGGAIYNDNTSTVNITADNSNVSFENNYTGTVTRDTEGNITDSTSAVKNDIHNEGTVNLNAKEGKSITFGGSITDASTLTGTTNIGGTGYTGTVNFNGTVTQKGVGVNSGTVNFNNTVTSNDLSNAGTVNVKASDLNVANGVSNSGALNLKEGTLASNISGAGTTNIKGNIVANANITQNTLTVDNTLTINPEKTVTVNNTLNNNSTITNNGGLNLAGGTTTTNLVNAGTISGSGITTISGVVNNTGKITSSKTGETAGVNVTGTLTTSASNTTSANGIANTGTINFISGETQSNISGSGTTNINGDVTISKTISNNKLVLNSGTTTLTSTGSIAGANSLTANGGGVNVVDDTTSTVDFGNIILKEDLKLSIDVNFADSSADVINGSYNTTESTANKEILIQKIHVLDPAAPIVEANVRIVDADSNLKSVVDLADDITIDDPEVTTNYMISYNKTTGNVDLAFTDIKQAIASNIKTRIYNMKEDESVNVDLGAMGGGDNAKLTINGNGHTLSNDGNHSGVSVADSQKLNINGLTVSNMTTAITNNNGGEVNITDSTFTGNSVDIHNESALNIKPTDGKFVIFNSVIEDNTTTKTGVLTVDGAGIAIFNDAVTQNEIGVNNGTANFNGVVNTTKTTVSGGKANFNNTTNTDEVNITGGVANFNAQVNTSDMILTDGTTSVNADNLNVSNGINNNATLNITGGTLNSPNTISGTNGTTNFTGNTTNNVTIDQKNVSVSNGKILTNTQTINATGTLTNNGTINTTAAITAGTLVNDSKITSTADITTADGQNNGSISTDAAFTNTGNFANNSTLTANTFANSGNFVNDGDIAGKVAADNVTNNGTISTSINNFKTPNDIQNEGTITYTSGTETTNNITGSSSGNVVLATGDNLILNNVVSGNQLTLQNSTIIPTENTDFTQASQLNINGGGMNVLNNELTDTNLGNVVMNNNTNLALDFNLSNMKSDTFTTSSLTTNGNKFNVNNIKISGNTQKDRFSINLGDTTNLGAGNVTSDNIKLPTIMTPIRKIHGNLKDGMISYAPSGNDWKEYNPSVLAAPIAAQLGGYLTQLNTYDEAFQNRDMKLLMTKKEKEAYKFANKYADVRGGLVYTHSYPVEQEPAMWYRGYATFERVNLNRGPKVSNILYGAFGGGESKMYDIGHGFHVQYSGYLGYTGSHQAFLGNDIYQNGGTLGATAMLYKGNFFTGITANVGASVADVSTRYGSEDFPMILGGAAWKIGYNWELAQSKFIIQPSYMMSYSFVDAFNYTNAAGVRIKDSTLNAINIAPGLKFIGNLKNGWQPYASIQMVWNIMDKTKFTAADIQLPYMSVRPFIQYGVGIQKHHGDRFTGYFQTVLRNGGRNGVALSLGFRWALGKKPQQDYKKTEVKSEKIKPVNNKKSETIKVKKDEVTKLKVEKTKEDKINSKKIKNTQPKVDFQLKQPNVKLDKM